MLEESLEYFLGASGIARALFVQMRALAVLVLTVCPAWPQFKSTVPLVVAPTTVTDAKGQLIDGLTEKDLILYDNNVPQAIQVDTLNNPISLAVVIQASANSAANLDKLRGSGSLFSDLLAADAGETAILSFSDTVRLAQDFTVDSGQLGRALRSLRVQGTASALLDAVSDALHRLAARDPARRRVMLVIAERRDRSSKTALPDLLREGQLQNTTIYWLTYSAFLNPFTNRPKTIWDRMSDEEKAELRKNNPGKVYPSPEEEKVLPPDWVPGSLLNVFTELKHRSATDVAALLSKTSGGRTFDFLKQSALESAIQAVAQEVHWQYIVTFQPKPDAAGLFHVLRAEVKGRPQLQARTRAGYWSIQ